MNFGVIFFALGLSAVACSADEPSVPANTAVDAAAAPVADGTAADADDSGKFFLFAQRSVTTSFTITTSTTAVLSTCFSAVASGTLCAGRRKRRFVEMGRSFTPADGEKTLDSSLTASIDDDNEVADPKDGPAKNSKYFFTLWETSTSTLVVVSTSTNAVNVVSVSAQCSIMGATFPPCG